MHGNIYNFQKHFCKGSEITSVIVMSADFKGFIILVYMLFNRKRDAITNQLISVLRKHITADKTAGTPITIIKRVDIPEQIMK